MIVYQSRSVLGDICALFCPTEGRCLVRRGAFDCLFTRRIFFEGSGIFLARCPTCRSGFEDSLFGLVFTPMLVSKLFATDR